MPRIEQGWKVVRRVYSAMYSYTTPGSVRYRYREYVKPLRGFGPLCVFKTEASARKFNDVAYIHTRVCPCLYRPSKQVMVWRVLGRDKKYRHINTLPPGTALASSVKLLKNP